MKITFFGTTTLLFDDGKDQILFDAHLTRPPIEKMVIGKISSNEKMIEMILEKYKMNRLRAIFVSHSHHDHVMDAPFIAKRCNCDVYGSYSTLNVAKGSKIDENKLHEFICHKPIQMGDFCITVIPSLHSKAKWYNNDLGKVIDQPFTQPARRKKYKEGGSFDFLIEHKNKNYLIRPSCNYIKNQNDGIKADVLFLGIGGLSKLSKNEMTMFFEETIGKVQPDIVIPIHWDNFFVSLDKPTREMPSLFENTNESLFRTTVYCEENDISCIVLLPRSYIQL